MAAIFSGIHLKLKSPQTPWEDKLKLARFAWVSSQCVLPNKEQVLLDWCTHALTGWYSQKVEFSQNVLEDLWLYLNDLLHSQKLQSLLKQGKTVSLRLNMAQLLLDRLQEYSHAGSDTSISTSLILSVCQGVVSSPVLSSIFITKYELLVDLLVKLCAMACVELQQQQITGTSVTESSLCSDASKTDCQNIKELPTKPKSKSSILFELLLQVVTCYSAVQRQQANPNRVLVILINHLFQPFVLLRHLLTSADLSYTRLQRHQQMWKDICSRIDSILLFALFPSEHFNSYKEELLPTKANSGKRGAGGAKGPLKPVAAILSKLTAQDYCDLPLLYSLKTSTASLLFKFFLDSYAKGKGENEEEQKLMCFHFLTRLVPILDLGPDMPTCSPSEADQHVSASPGQTPSPASPTLSQNWSLALTALESLLSQAVSADIYNVASDRIRHGEIQLNFFRALGQMLLHKVQPSIPAWHHCFKVLLSLNHHILEPDLDQLLSLAWVNFECTDAQVQKARQVLVCSLLQIYTKLRQLPHLFSELLLVICQPALEELRPPLLFDGFYSSLSSCLLDTPLSQSLEICSLVLDSIKKYVLPDLASRGQDDDEMKDINQEEKRQDASLKLLSLSQLLHAVLFHTKSVDGASPLPLVKQVKVLMSEMHQVVQYLQQLLSDENPTIKAVKGSGQSKSGKVREDVDHKEAEKIQMWGQKTVEATLVLRYSWVEMDMLFDLHCSKYKCLDSAEVRETEGKDAPRAAFTTHMETHGCVDFLPACLSMSSSTSPMTCLFNKLITLQQVKKVMLDNTLLSGSSITAVKKAVKFLLTELKSEVNTGSEHEWDGQICNVNSNSYAIAYWYLVTTNLPLIAPYLSQHESSCFTDVLVNSLLNRSKDQKDDQPFDRLTVAKISSQLLESPLLPELPSLFSSLVRSLTRRIRDVLTAAHQELSFSKLLTSESIIVDILETSKTGEVCVPLSDSQVEELMDLVHILRNLTPDGMNSEDLCSVFFLLLFMLTSTFCQQDPVGVDSYNAPVHTVFFVHLLKTLNFLVECSNLKGVLKVIHGGPLLQTVVSCLRWHSSNRRFATTSDTVLSGLIKAEQNFIRSLVQLIIINNISVQLNLDQFVSFLTQNVRPNSEASFPCVYLELASLSSLAKVLNSSRGRSKSLDQTLTSLVSRVTLTLGSAIEVMFKPQTACIEASQLGSDFSRTFAVKMVTVLLECELTALLMETFPSFKHMPLYQDLCQQILNDLSSNLRPMDFLVSSLHFLSTFYKAVEKKWDAQEDVGKEQEALYVQILQSVCRLLTAPWLSSESIAELEPAVQELLLHLTEKSSTCHLTLLLFIIRDGLQGGKLKAGNYREVLSAVTVTKLLFSCQLPDTCSQALWLIAPDIISAMVFLVRSCSQDASLTLTFTVPTVVALTSILRHGEGLLSNPHHVVVALEALQCVSLDHSAPHGYLLAFQAVHEGLFAVIQCHSQVMLNAAPSFLNIFFRLVTSIMSRGLQRGYSKTVSADDVYLQCSRLIERMYSHIAVTSENFTTMSAYIVAQYVTELQKVTLRADIKLHLTEGIYQILDLCTEHDIKFLLSGLHMGVREVFNELYSSYTHYHKTQRQGEEKYTV